MNEFVRRFEAVEYPWNPGEFENQIRAVGTNES